MLDELLNWLKTSCKSIGFKVIAVVICVLLAVVFFFSSCGTTRVMVQRPAGGTSTTISVTTNNPVSVSTDPTLEVPLSIPSKNP